MDLFRSKKRDNDFHSDGEVPSSSLKKKRGLARSVDNILSAVQGDNGHESATDHSLSADSDGDDFNKASKRQKTLAKRTIKWEKKKEKEYKRKIEKNFISMEDFLSKQSEFKMWLYEEKHKNAGSLTSPKLKVFFKQFVRLWNKKKLPGKYYRGSDLQSPTPLTPRKFDFDGTVDQTDPLALGVKGQVTAGRPEIGDDKDPSHSPFITFGKTPPKVFKSKKLQLFGSPDIALISIAPLGSPKPGMKNKENKPANQKVVASQYQVPTSPTKLPPVATSAEKTLNTKEEEPAKDSSAGPVTPYKVSVFPWAVDEDNTVDLDVCSTATPPNSSFGVKDTDPAWPPPPTEEELSATHGAKTPKIQANERLTKSPRVPPPPPPRGGQGSTCQNEYMTLPAVPNLNGTYSDPYDKLSEKGTPSRAVGAFSDYQDPVDCIPLGSARTVPDNVNAVLKGFSTSEQEDPSVLYAKPVKTKAQKVEVDIEELYAKPNKMKKRNAELQNEGDTQKNDGVTETNSNICGSKKTPDLDNSESLLNPNKSSKSGFTKMKTTLSKQSPICRKKGVLAASTDKIYETYLSLGKHTNPFKQKSSETDDNRAVYANVLKKKFKSQPDVSFSETGGLEEDVFHRCGTVANGDKPTVRAPFLSSFGKPLNTSVSEQDITDKSPDGLYESIAAQSNHIRRFLEGPSSEEPKYVKLSVAESEDLKKSACPGTPVIRSTPSFESLCAVTPISQRSGSSQSLPCPSASNDSLSLSTSTDKSVSAESLPSATELKNRAEEIQGKRYRPETEHAGEVGKSVKAQHQQDEAFKPSSNISDNLLAALNNGTIPMTPGKISAAKHGLDLSVYLLKQPAKPPSTSCDQSTGTTSQSDVSQKVPPPVAQKPSKSSTSSAVSKVGDNQSRLAIRETLSGVKTKVDSSKGGARKEQVRRHTVQTVHEIKTLTTVPTIGIASKARKLDTGLNKSGTSQVRSKREMSQSAEESESKRVCTETVREKGRKQARYLETDIDSDPPPKKPPLKKSKSHSGFELGASAVVTDIW